ncbi:DNRLRE domain-containing protein [Clostridium aestuarii]|uniref:DNRLRE domain-containing protein n=1 Tax=Clostridium aestuarii TaxID=338193 RepID=A0ABT4CXR3_9CLOT|nr:DNRLRE domain-containing protein [Clostridium aestuarii]MCY6482740.1 DNRLRE domain-containing protein [Clostridium aestuarii]
MPTLLLEAIQDASISQEFPDANIGHDQMFFCGKYGNGPTIYRSLLKFDISCIPKLAVIESVFLKLYISRNDMPSIVKPTKIYNLLDEFNENTVTYSNQPSFNPVATSALDISSQLNTYLQWDITSLVSAWHTGNIENHGLLLRGLESLNSFTGFISKDNIYGDKHPVIEITYKLDGGIIEYTPENITSSGDWAYSTPIPLGNRNATFGVENYGPKNACIILQLSSDATWLDSHSTYVSLCTLEPGNDVILTTVGHMAYVRLKCKALECINPDDYATLKIYPTITV